MAALAEPLYSPEQALDFDFGFLDFDRWYEAMEAEVEWREPDKSHEGKSPYPRFGTVEEILRHFNTSPNPAQQITELGLDIDIDQLVEQALQGVEPLF